MTAINDKYQALGGAGGWLGPAVGAELWCPDLTGRFRHYRGGSIYWHPQTGAHEVHGMIRDRWAALGWERSWLGYPLSDELDAPGGKISRFSHGAISWRPDRGAWDHAGFDNLSQLGRSHAEHQADCNRLIKQGWRLLTICVYGDPADPRYATTWIRTLGPRWTTVHGLEAATFDRWLQAQEAQGLTATRLTVAGDGQREVFAAVVELGAKSRVLHGLRPGNQDPQTLGWWLDWARSNHMRPSEISCYGAVGDPRFALLLRPNPDSVPWDLQPSLLDADDEQARFVAHTSHGARPITTARESHGGGTASIYHDDDIGPWTARGDMSQAICQAELAARSAEGYMPVALQAGGRGSQARFFAVFAKREDPLPSRFVATGEAVPILATIDRAVEGYMQRNGIPAASVAVAHDGRLVYARGFSWGPSTMALTSPTDLLRIASCSKVLTSLLIHSIAEDTGQGGLLMRRACEILDITGPTKSADFRRDITVLQLLRHESRLQGDFAHLDPAIVAVNGGQLPLTDKIQLARFLLTASAYRRPQDVARYSNSGYAVLGAIIETLTGMSWFEALRIRVLRPLGLFRPRVAASLLTELAPTELRQRGGSCTLAPSMMTPDQPLVRAGYGDANLGVGVGVGGMSFAAADFVRILAALRAGSKRPILSDPVGPNWSKRAGWGAGTTRGGASFYSHDGGLENTHSRVCVRDDGLAFAAFFAREGRAKAWPMPEWNDILDAVQGWPPLDLFPALGLRSD